MLRYIIVAIMFLACASAQAQEADERRFLGSTSQGQFHLLVSFVPTGAGSGGMKLRQETILTPRGGAIRMHRLSVTESLVNHDGKTYLIGYTMGGNGMVRQYDPRFDDILIHLNMGRFVTPSDNVRTADGRVFALHYGSGSVYCDKFYGLLIYEDDHWYTVIRSETSLGTRVVGLARSNNGNTITLLHKDGQVSTFARPSSTKSWRGYYTDLTTHMTP